MIDPAVWPMVAAHPDLIPDDLRTRLLPVPSPPPPEPGARRAAVTEQHLQWCKTVREIRFIDPSLPPEVSFQPKALDVIRICAMFYRVTVADIFSQRREKWSVRARKVAVYIIRHTTTLTLTQIASYLGDRDHSTVQKHCKNLRAKIETDDRLRDEIEILMRKVSEACGEESRAAA